MEIANVPLLAATIACLSVVEIAKTIRWRMTLGDAAPSWIVCLRALLIGQAVNALLPIRGGEAARLAIISAAGAPPAVGIASIAAVKAIDAICLATIAVAVVGTVVIGERIATIGASVLAIGVFAALAVGGDRARALIRRVPLVGRLGIDRIVEMTGSMRGVRLAVILVATIAVWLAGASANALVLAASGIAPSVGLSAAMLVGAYVSGILPAPPGRLGVFEAGIVAPLVAGGVDPGDALRASLTLHACLLVELGFLYCASLVARRAWLQR
ncbi:MAG: flippase-like domain-containing protein [Chloroflexota bacterium]|nr:MAG: flippase-like domain-containing protein [Chloroflexota bacterium]